MADKPNVDLTIPMMPDMELTAITVAESLGVFIGLDTEKIDEVKMALIEACINAFEHSKSSERRINLNFQISDRGMVISISDGGQGFDLQEALERIEEKRNKGEKRGWGLTLMSELMDEVEVDSSEEGTLVKMTKYR
ncbi:MAG: ATP-binding protein [Gemmatimonadetes bacterium]|nr:ATP-binding protein [Gemmatimonadota bacterium]MBT7551187.1 ATP-binding protein [Gemmatimonadota bacterium]